MRAMGNNNLIPLKVAIAVARWIEFADSKSEIKIFPLCQVSRYCIFNVCGLEIRKNISAPMGPQVASWKRF